MRRSKPIQFGDHAGVFFKQVIELLVATGNRSGIAAQRLIEPLLLGFQRRHLVGVAFAHDAITAPRQGGPWFEGYDNVSRTIS